MAITDAARLANFAAGIGTPGSVINVDNAANTLGVGTDTVLAGATLQVGTGVTIYGNSGIVSAVSFYGDGTNLTGIDASALTSGGDVKVQANAHGAVITGILTATGNLVAQNDVIAVGGTFTGGVGIAESIYHLSNTGTGVSFPANNIFTIKTNESERIRVDTSGNLIIKNPTTGGRYFKGIDTNGDEKILIGYETGSIVRIAEAFRVDFSASAFEPVTDNAYDLGQADKRWRNIYSADLQLSNEGSSNDVDGTWGKYTIQEGENDLFLINRRTGKKYKFMLEEVE